MNISVCITVFNEQKSVAKLLDSLVLQSIKPSEIIIVDGGSTDSTVEIIKHYQKKYKNIRLLVQKCSRAKGRNIACELSRNEIIAMTDAGCVADKDWLKKITHPFLTKKVDVVAGFYKMVPAILPSSAYKMVPAILPSSELTRSVLVSRAMSVFLGTEPKNFNDSFLPSTRSVAFTKKIWEEVGGFPENLKEAAEDTVFNYKLIKLNANISRVKDAVVEWGMPSSIRDFYNAIFTYSKGDAQSKVLIFPGKGLASHNIKALLIFVRYFVGLAMLLGIIFFNLSPIYLTICLFAYFYWSFRKAKYWGPILQIVSDFGVMTGFIVGLIEK